MSYPETERLNGRRVVVTGSTGFIGKHLCHHLERAGAVVIGVSRSLGVDVVTDALPLHGVSHVFHLAGLTYVPDSWLNPRAFFEVNALGTVRVLDQCRQRSIPVTYLSAYVYGIPHALPIREDAPVRPGNPYAFSKNAGEEACRFYAEAYQVDVKVLRVFNVYGPGQPSSFLIPTIARQVLDPQIAEIEVADLAPRRDFVHIDDVTRALACSIALPPAKPFNVGTGLSHSVGDVVEACLRIAGHSKPCRSRDERRSQEVMDVVADVTAIHRAIGWRPQIDFLEGIGTVMRSLRQ